MVISSVGYVYFAMNQNGDYIVKSEDYSLTKNIEEACFMPNLKAIKSIIKTYKYFTKDKKSKFTIVEKRIRIASNNLNIEIIDDDNIVANSGEKTGLSITL